MSWWDWHLYLIRYSNQIESKKIEHEARWAHTREIIAIIVNVNRDPKKPAIKGSDLIKLSFDGTEAELDEDKLKEIQQENADYFKEMKAKFGKIKKKNASK